MLSDRDQFKWEGCRDYHFSLFLFFLKASLCDCFPSPTFGQVIGSRALALQDQGYRVLLGYEEAIGFACGGVIPDKDGVSALGVMATLATSVYSRGETLASHLQQIHDKYGEFVSNNGYYFCSDPAIVKRVLEQMRNDGK